MPDKVNSLLARLKNKSKETGRSYQLCLQLFAQEEFLRRLQNSDYAENFILKGGLFIYSLTNFESRVTMDIDFLMKNLPNTPEKIKTVIENIIATNTGNDFIIFEIRNIESITLTKKYAGIGISLIARIKNIRVPFSIDLGIGDAVIPESIKREIPTQLADFETPVINTYSLETTIAEKLDAILDLMEFSSRMKDYYDIYYLSMKFDFDGNILSKALATTFKNRGHSFNIEQFEQIMSYGTNDVMQKRWENFSKKINFPNDGIDTVLNSINTFIKDVFISALGEQPYDKKWISSQGIWE
jgi:predicted nucleotidyltransferase component of viral defense system